VIATPGTKMLMPQRGRIDDYYGEARRCGADRDEELSVGEVERKD